MPADRVNIRAWLGQSSGAAPYPAFSQKPPPVAVGSMREMQLVKGRRPSKETIVAPPRQERSRADLKFSVGDSIGLQFDSSQEVVEVKETVVWLPGHPFEPPKSCALEEWPRMGPKKSSIEGETVFCDPRVLDNVLKATSVIDILDKKELLNARSRANPFEQVHRAYFLNTAAMEMADLDAAFGFMFTNPTDQSGNAILRPSDLLLFAEVFSGPGGFSEYILWRREWKAKGTGFIIQDPNSSPTLRSANGTAYKDGDICALQNMNNLHNEVQKNTAGAGVHFMLADGCSVVEGHEKTQEMSSKRIFLSECLVALRIVRLGGHFVVKLLDLYTPFTVGLVYLMHRCFEKISIFKPNTSRFASSERYLVCAFKRDCCDDVIVHLTKMNMKLEAVARNHEDLLEIVTKGILKEEKAFFNYIVESNNVLGQRQAVQLSKLVSYSEDPTLVDTRQNELRMACLQFYGVPDKMNTATAASTAADLFGQPIEPIPLKDIPVPAVAEIPIQKILYGPRDWLFCAIGCQRGDVVGHPTFFLGLGGAWVYRLEGRDQWLPVTGISLPGGTLVYGELTTELQTRNGDQKKISTLHIIDACVLGGLEVADQPFNARHSKIEKFVNDLKGNSVRVKKMYDLFSLEGFLSRVENKTSRNGTSRLAIPLSEAKDRYMYPGGLLFVSKICRPWTEQFSVSQQRQYFFNVDSGTSVFDAPTESFANFSISTGSQLMWWWDEGVRILPHQPCPSPKMLQPEEIINYVKEVLQREGRLPQRTQTRVTALFG